MIPTSNLLFMSGWKKEGTGNGQRSQSLFHQIVLLFFPGLEKICSLDLLFHGRMALSPLVSSTLSKSERDEEEV